MIVDLKSEMPLHFKLPFGVLYPPSILHNNDRVCREMFAPDLLHAFVPSWQVLPSPRNITVESGWRPLFYTWGNNILEFYYAGIFNGFFEAGNVLHE